MSQADRFNGLVSLSGEIDGIAKRREPKRKVPPLRLLRSLRGMTRWVFYLSGQAPSRRRASTNWAR